MSLHIPKSLGVSAFAAFGLSLRSPAPRPPIVEAAGEVAVEASAPPPDDPAPPTPKALSEPCASGMVLVDGNYCPEPEQVCLKWLDPPPYENLRCGEYKKPATCKVPRVHQRFCVDREEFPENAESGESGLPLVNKSYTEAQALCDARGARLCREPEWELACEGEDMNPYPYGFSREPGVCNIDRTDLGGMGDRLIDHRAAFSEFPRCTSAFGVHDLTGNVDEWVERENMSAPHRSALRGGWWLPGRNRCRAATLHHDEGYAAKQVGFRCCAASRGSG